MESKLQGFSTDLQESGQPPYRVLPYLMSGTVLYFDLLIRYQSFWFPLMITWMLSVSSNSTTKPLRALPTHVFRLRNRIPILLDLTRDECPRMAQKEETEAAYGGVKEYDSEKDGAYEADETEYM